MAERAIITDAEFYVGQLVKWYELYADGFLTKDAGYGLVIKINEHAHLGKTYHSYVVFRNKHSDTMTFSLNELETVAK